MKTLFIDTHSEVLDITLIDDDDITSIIHDDTKNHSEIAIPSLIELLNKKNIELKDIDEIIVINGPGSFTGVRIGVTIAKTIAYSLNIPIKPITSLEAYGESENGDFDVIAVPDSKGFYSALKCEKTYTEFIYSHKNDFEKYINDNDYKYIVGKKFDYKKILSYLKDKPYINPHSVNPIYIKEIDALK